MSIARPPANSPKIVVKSTEGLNLDQWQGVNLAKFIPEILQQIIQEIQTLLDTVSAIIELAIEALRILSALSGSLFDILRAIIEAIAQTIKDLLDIFPKLDAGLYLLYVNTELGGIDYFTQTFRSSLNDRNDPMRPPLDDNIPFYAMFVIWGYPFYDQAAQKAKDAGQAFLNLFGLNDGAKISFNGEVPPVDDFTVQNSFFTKPVETVETVTNTIDLPENVVVDGARDKIRTTIRKVSRKSGTKGVAHNLSWRIPENFTNFTRERNIYRRQVVTENNITTYRFTRQTIKIIGIDILQSKSKEALVAATSRMQNPSDNTVGFSGSNNYASGEEQLNEDVLLIHRALNPIPGTNNIQLTPADAETETYFYTASYVYDDSYVTLEVERAANGQYSFYEYANLDYANRRQRSSYDFGTLASVNFEEVDPLDLNYSIEGEFNPISFVGPHSKTVQATPGAQIAPLGTPPDWLSFRGFGDLLPEIQRFIDQAKQIVDNIVNEILDDSNELQRFIENYIRELERKLNEINDLVKRLNSLIFAPLAGAHYLSIKTQFGMPAILDRYERSLQYGLRNASTGNYNPILLDREFQSANTAEFERRVEVPAYDFNHKVGGFILAFQEPAVQGFMEDLLGLKTNFTEEFQRILDDERLQLDDIRFPQLRDTNIPTNPFVISETDLATGGFERPDDLMNQLGDYKTGVNEVDDVTNGDGNVELKSNSGPYTNDGPPIDFNVLCSDDGVNFHWNNVIVPRGTITAEQMANLITCPTSVNDDGSFVIESKFLRVSECSGAAASLFGFEPGQQVEAPNQNPILENDFTEVSDGELVVEFVNNGKPDYEQIRGTVPIFQLKDFSSLGLNSENHLLKFEIEGNEAIIDVTGNLGTNTQAKSPTWEFSATYPLVLVAEDIPNGITGNNKFTFQISGTPVTDQGISDAPVELTLQAVTYPDARSINAEILRLLVEAGYPVGAFTTTTNEDNDESTLLIAEAWGQTADVTLSITPGSSADFLVALDTSVVNPGTDYVPYTIQEVVDNLNAAFTEDYFSVEENSIRITGTTIGPSGRILVYTSIENPEFANVALTLFGFNQLQTINTEVLGIGSLMTSFEYFTEIETDVYCSELQDDNNQLFVEIETPSYEVELQESSAEEYFIEFV